MHTIISVVMAIVMTLYTSLGVLNVKERIEQTAARSPAQAVPADVLMPELADAVPTRDGVDWEDMEYRHYDPELFYYKVDRLTALAGGEDADAIISLYDELHQQYIEIDTMNSLAYIHYCDDVTDEYWSQEMVNTDVTLTETHDALCTACAAIMSGPCADAFAQHVGEGPAGFFAGYIPMSDREAELTNRESELVDEYYTRLTDSDDVTYTYLGETWTYEKLDSFQGNNLINNDYDGYLEVFFGLQKAVNDLVGPIFMELVQIRAEIAELNGYDSYADLAYEQIYGRDYTTADAQVLCDAVKPVAMAFNNDLYSSPLWYAFDIVEPALDADAQIQALGGLVRQIDPVLEEPWQFMTDHDLCDLTDDPGAFPGGYTITLTGYDCPFIFNSLYGDYYDFKTLTHEFGHYTKMYYAHMPDPLTALGNYDLQEIYSNGLESLCTEFYDDVYTRGADVARFCVLGGQIQSVIDGCIYDEFQRQIYAQPDMTLEDINRLFADISQQYGQYEPLGVDYGWVNVSHTFESPLYYISYAASSLAAIQIWSLAQEDFQAGVEMWKALLDTDPFTDGYMTALPECGLRLFTEDNAVSEICQPLIEELRRLDAGF